MTDSLVTHGVGDLSDLAAGINLVKGILGLGMLTFAHSASKIGWVTALVMLAVVGFSYTRGLLLVVKLNFDCGGRGQNKEATKENVSYGTAEAERNVVHQSSSLPTHPRSSGLRRLDLPVIGAGFLESLALEAFGDVAKNYTVACIIICQFLTGVAYIETVTTTLSSYFQSYHHADKYITFALGGLLIILSSSRRLTGVTWLSVTALVVYGFIFAAIGRQYALKSQVGNLSNDFVPFVAFNYESYGSFLGAALFAWMATGTAVPVCADMQEPANCFKVVWVAHGFCYAAFAAMTLLGLRIYGHEAEELIFLSFQEGSPERHISSISISIILMLSYTLVMWPVYKYAEYLCRQRLHYMIVRSLVVLLSVTFCMFFSTSSCMELSGVCGASIGFVLPPLLHFKLAEGSSITFTAAVLNCMLIAFGLFASLLVLSEHLQNIHTVVPNLR